MKKIFLPKHIVPTRYKLILKPDLSGFTFEGEEEVELKVLKQVKSITLHSKDLEVGEVFISSKKSKLFSKSLSYNTEQETVTLDFKTPLKPGRWVLNLKFKGVLNDQMRGFYRSEYRHKGKTRHLATTQFEATDARRAFPCFDEPDRKAVFDITLITPPGMVAVSNSVELNTWEVPEHGTGYRAVKFAPTPKMSTYLAAFIVGDFEYIEKKSKRGVTVRVFTTPGKKDQARFALNTAVECLEFYEKYFEIDYPLPILDLIAVPDFASAAMENWGAIVYRESALLFDEKSSTQSTKQWVAIVIAHEIAHQWFGNLVTMQWWTHLWLNEGFASYMEYRCVDAIFPKWHIWEQYVSGRLASALSLDALGNTHPIEVKVHHPHEISEIFDAVSYAKGSAVIRMLASYLGEEKFRKGLRLYLKKYAYKNATTEDLWRCLAYASKKDVKGLMQNWTQLPGYPLVKVVERPKTLVLSQQRFFSSRVTAKAHKSSEVWSIPLKYGEKDILLDKTKIEIPKPSVFTKFNLNETSLVRIDYPSQYLRNLFNPQKISGFKTADRLGLVRDVFALVESGQFPISEALAFVKAYEKEESLSVWEEILSSLSKLLNLTYGTDVYAHLQKFCVDMLAPLAKKLGSKKKPGESQSQTLLRSLTLGFLGLHGQKEAVEKAQSLFKKPERLDPDLKSYVYSTMAKWGGSSKRGKLVAMFLKTDSHEEKDRIARALSHCIEKKLIKENLKFFISQNVRHQDKPYYLGAMLARSHSRELAWAFIKKNFPYFAKNYAAGLGLIARMLQGAASFVDLKSAKDFENFFKKHKVKAAERTISQVLEKILSNNAWQTHDLPHLREFFRTKAGDLRK